VKLRLVFEEAARSIRSSVSTSVAATLTVLVAMFVLGLALALGTWLSSYGDYVKRQLVVHIYFETNVTGQEVNGVANRLAKDPRVKSYTFVTRAEALRKMKKRFPDLVKNLAYNPLPPSFDVVPTKGEFTPKIANTYQHPLPPGVHNIAYGQETTKRILHYANVFNILFAIALAILVAASTLLIANTIRLSLFSRRREIEVMKLVGATNWFVRGPFMIEGLLQGLGGAILAVLFLILGKEIALPAILHHALSSDPDVHALAFPLTSLILLGMGLALGALGSGLTLRRFLKV
jgi:cell division transport system permease protein